MRRIDITYMSGYDDDAVDEDACFMARSKIGVIQFCVASENMFTVVASSRSVGTRAGHDLQSFKRTGAFYLFFFFFCLA